MAGYAVAFSLMAVPGWMEAAGYLDGQHAMVVWAASMLGAVGSALLGSYFDRNAAPPPQPPGRVAANNLRTPIEEFVGYTTECDAMLREFQRFRRGGWRRTLRRTARSDRRRAPLVFMIDGSPGTGKSQLAIRVADEVADRFPDGVRWMDLYGDRLEYGAEALHLTEQPGLGTRLARWIRWVLLGQSPGLGEEDEPRLGTSAPRTADNLLTELLTWLDDTPRVPRRRLEDAWRSLTKDKRVLLVLENAEDPETLAKLLPSGPGSAVIVTARRAIKYASFSHQPPITLNGFTREEGLELLDHLAPVQGTRAERERELGRRREIVDRCDGLPLAVGLCGKLLSGSRGPRSSKELLGQLKKPNQSLVRLASEGFAASFMPALQSCDAAERLLLRRMAATGLDVISEPAAAALLGRPLPAASAVLEGLYPFLLENVGASEDGISRYRIPQLVREALTVMPPESFGIGRQRTKRWVKHTKEARLRLVRVHVWLTEQAAAQLADRNKGFPQPPRELLAEPERLELSAPDPGHNQAWLERENEILLRLVEMAEGDGHPQLGWRLARALCSMFQVARTHWAEWEQGVQAQYRLARIHPNPYVEGMALLDIAEFASSQGDYDRGVACAAEALEIFRREDAGELWSARARRALGVNLQRRGDLDTAQRELAQAERVFTSHGEGSWLARTQVNLADLESHREHYDTAVDLLHVAEVTFESAGDREQYYLARLSRAEVTAYRGHDLYAWYVLRDLRDIFTAGHRRWYLARCLHAMGSLDPARLQEQHQRIRLAFHPEYALERIRRIENAYLRHCRAQGRHPAVEQALEERAHFAAMFERDAWVLLGEYTNRARRDLRGERTRSGKGESGGRWSPKDWSPGERVARLNEAIELFDGMDDEWGAHRARLTLGLIHLRTHRVKEGEALLQKAAAGFAEMGSAWWSARSHRFTAEALLDDVLGQRRVAPDAAPGPEVLPAVTRLRDLAGVAQRQAEQARDGYQDLANDRGQIRTMTLLARALRAKGATPPNEVLSLLKQAQTLAEEQGHSRLAEEAEYWRQRFDRGFGLQA